MRDKKKVVKGQAGQVLHLRVPDKMYAALRKEAERQRRTIHNLAYSILANEMDKEKPQ